MAHSEKGTPVLTNVQKAHEVLSCKSLHEDFAGKKLTEESALIMRRLGREVRDSIDIVVAASQPQAYAIKMIAEPVLEVYGVTYAKALDASRLVHNHHDFKGRGVLESFTPELVDALAALYDDHQAHEATEKQAPGRAAPWSWTKELVRHAMLSKSPAILVLRGEG